MIFSNKQITNELIKLRRCAGCCVFCFSQTPEDRFSHVKDHMGLDATKRVLEGVANNTGADQPPLACSLISAFVIRFLNSIISKLALSEI